MPTIPDDCQFEVGADQVRFNTQTNGDSVAIKGLHFDSDQAASLAHMINAVNHQILEIKIRPKVP